MSDSVSPPNGPVSPDDGLYRRTYPQRRYVSPDGKATSRAFKLRAGEDALSVDAKSLITPEASLTGNYKDPIGKYALFEVSVRDVVRLGLQAVHDSLPYNSAHALITGLTEDDDTLPGELARLAEKVVILQSVRPPT